MDTNLVKQMIGAQSGSNFSQVTIGLASPEIITSWSRGEIKNPETINFVHSSRRKAACSVKEFSDLQRTGM